MARRSIHGSTLQTAVPSEKIKADTGGSGGCGGNVEAEAANDGDETGEKSGSEGFRKTVAMPLANAMALHG